MAKNEPIRLVGTDEVITVVARHAWHLVAVDRESRGVLSAVDQLGRKRRAFMRQFSEPTITSTHSPTDRSAAPVAPPVFWYVLLGIGLLCAVAAAAFAGPATRRIKIDAATAMPIIAVATIAAIAVLAMVLLVWLRYRHRSSEALTLVIIVGLMVAAVLIYRFVVGPTSGSTDFTSDQLVLWQVGAIIVVIELVLIALQVRPAGEGGDRLAGAVMRSDGRHLLAEASRLAREDVPSAVSQAWGRDLDTIADLPLATAEQARQLGPVAWLVWTFYDGDIDVSSVASS